MKLIITIVNKEDADNLVEQLTKKNHPATKIDSIGGFLKKRNATLIVGTEEKKVGEIIKIIKKCCHSREEYTAPPPAAGSPAEVLTPDQAKITVGGATIFILDVEKIEKL